MSLELELNAALKAVKSAARVCQSVQSDLVTAETLEKKDKSPVTVADFAAQALVCYHLQQQLPEDGIVGEEDSGDLKDPEQANLLNAIRKHVAGELGKQVESDDVMQWIDRGNADASSKRYWTLDPIDGTKGFLRGEQYAIALALIEDGKVILGVLGCPNLEIKGKRGALFSAIIDEPASMYSLNEQDSEGTVIKVADINSASEARFCESVESGHSNQSESAQIAEKLGITQEPYRIDSQCKYAAVARNDASIYLRMPTRADYQEKIWDHAAGKLVVESAGGTVTDIHGKPLDFTQGRTLSGNQGVVATCGSIHDEVIAAIKTVRG